MAAYDSFDSFNSALPDKERDNLKDFIKARRQILLAARSEDERVRLVSEYIREVHRMLSEE